MLSRRWLVNGVMIAAIATLAIVGYHLEPASDSLPAAATAAIDADSVDRIEIRTPAASLSLQRQESGWVLREPLSWPADRASVERLIGIPAVGQLRPLEAADVDLASLGLDDPVARLQLGDTRISFGSVNNIGERRYTMIDAALFLLPDVYLPFILQGPSGFVDRRLLPARFELVTLNLPGMELRRDADGAWQAAAGEAIDPQRLAAMAADWQGLAASRVGLYDGSGSPTGRIVAGLGDGRQFEFLLLSADPEIVIANPALGLQYHFRADRYHRLISPPDDETAG